MNQQNKYRDSEKTLQLFVKETKKGTHLRKSLGLLDFPTECSCFYYRLENWNRDTAI